MTIDFISIGFDFRAEPSPCERASLRSDQMLDPHNQSPVCADASVWRRPTEVASSIYGGVLSDLMNPLYLYKNLPSLRRAYDRLTSLDERWPSVSITAHPAVASYLTQRFGIGYFDEYQREVDLLSTGWQHMGFDTVDLDGMVSGLKGCGYAEPALSDLRIHFLQRLNQYGLFASALDAAMFAQTRGLQIRDHSPFVVVGVLSRDFIAA
jgi:hypothetical protein